MYVTDHRHIRGGRSLARVRIPYQRTMARNVLKFTEPGASVGFHDMLVALSGEETYLEWSDARVIPNSPEALEAAIRLQIIRAVAP
jgi:hypothetical protein